jgi:hypothetical protein
MRERRAVTKEIARRYRASRKKEKGVILDEFTALTGYNRAYAVYLLNLHGKRVRAGGKVFFEVDVRRMVLRRRKSEYDSVRGVLVKIWEILGYPCGKRLKPILPEVVTKLEGFKELILGEEDKEKLFRMSAATIDRLLKEERKKTALKGRSHVERGTLLKRKIPLRICDCSLILEPHGFDTFYLGATRSVVRRAKKPASSGDIPDRGARQSVRPTITMCLSATPDPIPIGAASSIVRQAGKKTDAPSSRRPSG